MDFLSESQVRELDRLKAWLYRQRVKARAGRNKAERKERKEEAEDQREAEQPALFEF